MAFGDTGRSFLWWHKRGRTCISVSGVFAILILWQARLSGRNVSVHRQTADNTSALSHVFPLERASVQGFVPSIIFYFCLLSWFKRRLSAYSSPVIFHPPVPPPLALFLPSLQICYFLYSHSSSLCLPLLLTGGSGLKTERETLKSQGVERYRASEGGTPIFSQLSLYGHSAKEGKMYGGDWKRERDGVGGGGVMEAEGSIISAGRVGGDFFSRKSRGKIYLYPWRVQWNFTEYFALMRRGISGHKFVLPFGCQWWTIYYGAFKDTAWYLYDSAILCNDIHFIVPYNTNEKIKNKTARCGAGLALFIAI